MDGSPPSSALTLPQVPVLDAPDGPLDLLAAAPERYQAMLEAGAASYGKTGLKVGDHLSKRWIAGTDTPYLDDLHAVAREHAMGSGVYMLNLSYEWTCTAAVGRAPSGSGNRMLRTLDWPLAGLGRNVVVAKHESAAGPWFNVTWPGFVGSVTGMAPGRFSAAINQPPMKKFLGHCWADWVIERFNILRRSFMPPLHLLRHVFETCATFEEAKARLMTATIAMPAFFSLSGTGADESCIIERTETDAFVRDGDVAVSNHWVAAPLEGRMRGIDSPGRLKLMEAEAGAVEDDFTWVREPILNSATRLAVAANAARGTLAVQGYEAEGAVSAVTRI